MMKGRVNELLEPRLSLEIRGSDTLRQEVDAVIDTGFNGFLTLPSSLVSALRLPWLYRQHGELTDGSIQIFDVFEVTILWNDEPRTIEAEAVDAEPLLGMCLMLDQELRIEVRTNGNASIDRMP